AASISSLKSLALADVVSVGSSDSDSEGCVEDASVLDSDDVSDASELVSSEVSEVDCEVSAAAEVSGAGSGAGSCVLPHATRVAAKKTAPVSSMMRGLRD